MIRYVSKDTQHCNQHTSQNQPGRLAAQPCSYIYPIYSVVKNHQAATATVAPSGGSSSLLKAHELLSAHQPQTGRNKTRDGGAERDRTVDPLLAKQVLSQLSYSPVNPAQKRGKEVVGLGRFELPTSPLSGVRSNQLSYRPGGDLRTVAILMPARLFAGYGQALSKGFEDTVERAGQLRRP